MTGAPPLLPSVTDALLGEIGAIPTLSRNCDPLLVGSQITEVRPEPSLRGQVTGSHPITRPTVPISLSNEAEVGVVAPMGRW